MRPWLVGAVLLASLGTLILALATFKGAVSPRDDIAAKYRRVSADTYVSDKPPLVVASEIIAKNGTDERIFTPNGVYLRYEKEIVGILPEDGGSRITIDDPDRGYARYHSSVGGSWGGSGGRASSFRGGGPGGGGK
ncbi:MAG TPA: DUF4247 domain-containing protein [Spirillospora sp.]